jgi:hypothetical protein
MHTYNAYAAAHIDGTIDMKTVQIGVSNGLPLATFRVVAGIQSHPAYAISRCALKVFAYAEAAKRFDIQTIQVNLRANLISAEAVTVLVADGDLDIDWHPSSDVRNAAEFKFAQMTGRRSGRPNDAIPVEWPKNTLHLPIQEPALARPYSTGER